MPKKSAISEGKEGYTMTYRLKVAPSLPFLAANGAKFELHVYAFDGDGRRWEQTVAGPFDTEDAAVIALDKMLTKRFV